MNELEDGSKIPFMFDFVITEAQTRGSGSGRFHEAQSLHMVQRESGIAAKLVTFTLTRLPS